MSEFRHSKAGRLRTEGLEAAARFLAFVLVFVGGEDRNRDGLAQVGVDSAHDPALGFRSRGYQLQRKQVWPPPGPAQASSVRWSGRAANTTAVFFGFFGATCEPPRGLPTLATSDLRDSRGWPSWQPVPIMQEVFVQTSQDSAARHPKYSLVLAQIVVLWSTFLGLWCALAAVAPPQSEPGLARSP